MSHEIQELLCESEGAIHCTWNCGCKGTDGEHVGDPCETPALKTVVLAGSGVELCRACWNELTHASCHLVASLSTHQCLTLHEDTHDGACAMSFATGAIMRMDAEGGVHCTMIDGGMQAKSIARVAADSIHAGHSSHEGRGAHAKLQRWRVLSIMQH